MARLTDTNEIRACLRRDPAWSVYALGDLEPPMFPKTLWFAPDLTLIVRDYGTAILFAMGPGSVREALGCVAGPVHLQVQRDALDEVARHAAVSSPRLMWRMTWMGGRPPLPGCHWRAGTGRSYERNVEQRRDGPRVQDGLSGLHEAARVLTRREPHRGRIASAVRLS